MLEIAALALASLSLAPQQEYKPMEGPFEVRTEDSLTLQDADRDKSLALNVTYPVGEGPFPVLVVSHGLGGNRNGLGPVVESWASHGYVTIRCTHMDSVEFMSQEELAGYMQGRVRVKPEWMRNRAPDIHLILDSLDLIEDEVPALAGKLDRERMGMSGHSFGAWTTLVMAGATVPAIYGQEDVSSDLFDVFVAISPQGTGAMSFSEASFAQLDRPLMVITGSEDKDLMGRVPTRTSGRTDSYWMSPEGDKFLLWIEGAEHGFGGINGRQRFRNSGPQDPKQVAWVTQSGLAMWDAYLLGDEAAKAWLETDAMESWSAGVATLSHR